MLKALGGTLDGPGGRAGTGFKPFSIANALAAGLTFRPIVETARDTLAWDVTRPAAGEREAGLAVEDEARLLRVWHEQRNC